MRVPILKQGNYLIAAVQSALTDTDLLELREELVEQAGRFRSRGVIIDVTVLDIMDSFACRTLRAIAQMVRLRGADTVIIGLQPEVAFSMVQLGLSLDGGDHGARSRGRDGGAAQASPETGRAVRTTAHG